MENANKNSLHYNHYNKIKSPLKLSKPTQKLNTHNHYSSKHAQNYKL